MGTGTPMTKLERATRSRNAHGVQANKIVEKARALLDLDSSLLSASDITDLRGYYASLTAQVEEIKKKDEAIEELADDDKLDEVLERALSQMQGWLDVLHQISCHVAAATDPAAGDTTSQAAGMDGLKLQITRLTEQIGALSPVLTTGPGSSHASHSGSNTRRRLALPTLKPPTFDGDVTNWTAFAELFKAAVDDAELTNCEKMQYLKASLTGDAVQVISALPLTGVNYTTAWQLLEERFANKRVIVRTHLHRIVQHPPLKTDDVVKLRALWQAVEENRQALINQGLKLTDGMLVYLVSEKMDLSTRRQWELTSTGTHLQTYEELRTFMKGRLVALEATGASLVTDSGKRVSGKTTSGSSRTQAHHHSAVAAGSQTTSTCAQCQEAHHINQCSQFAALNVAARADLCKRAKLCYNCLRSGHSGRDCPSRHRCRDCKARHHTLLHRPAPPVVSPATATPQATAQTGSANTVSSSGLEPSSVLLPTAIIPVATPQGTQTCRALLDSGSQLTLISEASVKRLHLKKSRSAGISITGVGRAQLGRVKGSVQLSLPVPGREPITCNAVVLPQLTSRLPSVPVDASGWANTLDNFNLADPGFDTPSDVDLIIGTDVYDQVVLDSRREIRDKLYLRETVVGWVVSGVTTGEAGQILSHHTTSIADPDYLLRRFWELEDISDQSIWTADEAEFEAHFQRTTTRDDAGRLVVQLPFRQDAPLLGNSLHQAQRRFAATERRLSKDSSLKESYAASMKELIDTGHMELVPTHDLHKPDCEVFYLPHHPVFKEASTTTKMRVVFDGSAKSGDGGPSLNDALLVGPTIQDTLLSILFRFRFHRVALSADVAKMYRQVKLSDDSKDFHRILWRDDADQPIKHYRMTRVTFGVGSSAFHAVRCLHELATDADDSQQEAARVVKSDFYVDDLLSGAPDVHAAADLQDQLISLLDRGGFPLRKWSSNVPSLVERLPEHLRESSQELVFKDDAYNIKTLGIRWRPNPDTFLLATHDLQPLVLTKRALLSDSASFFDPLGWLAPSTLLLKALLQRSWTTGVGWDDDLPEEIVQEWLAWRDEMHLLKDFTLPRCVLPVSDVADIQLHVFCDASELAYGAVIYSRVTGIDGDVAVHLLASKTKVAPVKTVSLPRLELCAAHLGSRLTRLVLDSLSSTIFKPGSLHAWSDSTVTLAWISKLPRTWTTFVANRVSFIQDILPPSCWTHVPTKDNPADCASRGLRPAELLQHDLWWHGPPWLSGPPTAWPSQKLIDDDPPEQRPQRQVATVALAAVCLPTDFSSWRKLKRVTAWCLRFIDNIRVPKKKQRRDELDVTEIERAEVCILRAAQLEAFPDEVHSLMKKKPLPRSSSLVPLAPYLDEATGLLRVGGRLLHAATLSTCAKQPILISHHDPLALLIARDAHQSTLHSGNSATLAKTREQFWITHGRDVVRSLILRCVTCRRFAAQAPQPPMAALPATRVTPSRPFTMTGVDFGGPFEIKLSSTRFAKTGKAYVALFVCFSTKAVHLELVSSLSTEAFLATLRRFVARRGLPHTLHSDNGTNFTGAANELGVFLRSKTTQKELSTFASTAGMSWTFIPPRAPHFGGLWEAGIKRVKHHLRRVVGSSTLHFEELYTVLTQVEAMLNSRPLTPLTTDPNDLQALTPGHFLVGSPLNAVPDPPERHSHLTRRWRLVQELATEFWRRWSFEYLPTLQSRGKWTKADTSIISEGDLVLIAEDNTSPLVWPLARVTAVIKGADGVCRVADVTTAAGKLRRPLVKLRPLLPLDVDAGTSRGGGCSSQEEKIQHCSASEEARAKDPKRQLTNPEGSLKLPNGVEDRTPSSAGVASEGDAPACARPWLPSSQQAESSRKSQQK